MKRWLFAAPLVALAVALVPAGAAPQDKGKKDPPPTFTDPDKAGIDYKRVLWVPHSAIVVVAWGLITYGCYRMWRTFQV